MNRCLRQIQRSGGVLVGGGTLYIGETWHAAADGPFEARRGAGLLVGEDGRIAAHGDGAELRRRHPDAAVVDCGERILAPGLVDAHVHFPQIDMIGSHGAQLLPWLTRYPYPAEERYADPAYAAGA